MKNRLSIFFIIIGTSTVLLAQAPLFYSEYSVGESNFNYIEIYNPTDSIVSLDNYAFVYTFNEPTIPGEFETWKAFNDGAVIEPGDVYVISNSFLSQQFNQVDQSQFLMIHGNDCLGLVYGTPDNYTLLDVVGDRYESPDIGWDVAGYELGTNNHTLLRKSNIYEGNTDWLSSAGTNIENSEWIVLGPDQWSFLGSHENISDLYPIGCTDSVATFFCVECNLDDGSCEYPELNLSIAEIQGMSDTSPYEGQVVTAFGNILASMSLSTGHFIQDKDSLWSGIYVNTAWEKSSSTTGLIVTAKVREVDGLTILDDIISLNSYTYIPEYSPVLVPLVINEALSEKHESCFVEVIGKCVEPNNEFDEAVIELIDNGIEVVISSLIYEFDFQVDSFYRINGPVYFSNNEFKICPKFINSISPYVSIPEFDSLSISVKVINNHIEIESQYIGLQDYIIYNIQGQVIAQGVFDGSISISTHSGNSAYIVNVGKYSQLVVGQ